MRVSPICHAVVTAVSCCVLIAPSAAYAQEGTEREKSPSSDAAVGEQFDRFRLSAAGGDYSLRLGGLVQSDGRFFFDDAGPANTFAVRRARLDVRGTIARYLLARVLPQFGGGAFKLPDAYVNVGFIDEVQLRVGKMKSPLGQEMLESAADLQFAERGLPTSLVPNRDIGAMLHGKVADVASYQAGVFNGAIDGASAAAADGNSAKDLVGRVLFAPLVPLNIGALNGFGIGFAGSYGEHESTLPSHRTPGGATYFEFAEEAVADGPRVRIVPQGHYFVGPVGVTAEFVQSSQVVSDPTSSATLTDRAWQARATVVLGGAATPSGVEVDAPLDPVGGSWGALELVARFGQLTVDPETFTAGLADPDLAARGATNVAGAISWWFVEGSRLLVSFDHTAFDGGAVDGDRADENVLVARLQVAF